VSEYNDPAAEGGGYDPYEDDEIERLGQAVGEIQGYLRQQHAAAQEAQVQGDWDELLDDYPELQDDQKMEAVAKVIDKRAEAAGNPDLGDDPHFARQVMAELLDAGGSGVPGQEGPMSESDRKFLDMADRHSNQAVRGFHKRLGEAFGSSKG
jgi:hypothetical protein